MTTSSTSTIDLSYDVLGLEALFLVPRICSLLSLNPYFGTLVSLMSLVDVVLDPSFRIVVAYACWLFIAAGAGSR